MSATTRMLDEFHQAIFLIEATHRLIGCREYTYKRIGTCLYWGYIHCDKQEDCKTIAKNGFSQGNGVKNPSLSHLSRLSHIGYIFEHKPIKLADYLWNSNLEVSKDYPCYPMLVYENLPPFLPNYYAIAVEKEILTLY